MTDLQYPVVVKKLSDEDGGGYLAYAPDLHGCLGDGDTPEQAISNLKDAILEWVDEAQRLQRPIPLPGEAIEKAHKERKKMISVIRKQERLIDKQAESFDRLRHEVEQLRQQITELAEKTDSDDSDQVWERVAVGLAISKKVRQERIQH
jgi:antitoxin HicB